MPKILDKSKMPRIDFRLGTSVDVEVQRTMKNERGAVPGRGLKSHLNEMSL